MKTIFTLLSLMLIFTACKTEQDGDNDQTDAVAAAFEANSKTVMANIKGWQAENLDYSMYADDFYMYDTAFAAEKDSISLEEMKAWDKQMWADFDFRLVSELTLLPGVERGGTTPDGSVRHYPLWEVIKPATDSTEARSGIISLYESFDFDENGKILRQQAYGDFTGLMMHLHAKEESMDDN